MISRRLLARHIADQLESGTPYDNVMQSLAAYINEHRMQKQLGMIIGDIASELARRGTIAATVTTATDLTDALRQEVTAYLKQQYGDKTVTISETIDPSILGGVIVQTADKRFDASVASKLKRLRTTS